jgi:Tfp pilus assembly protein PilF
VALGKLYQLGVLYHELSDFLHAEYHLRRSLDEDPTDYWSHLYLANLLGVQGRDIEAEQTYRFATNLHPEITGGSELFARFLESLGKTREASELLEKAKHSS